MTYLRRSMYTLTFLFAAVVSAYAQPTLLPPWLPIGAVPAGGAKPTKLPSRAVQRLRRLSDDGRNPHARHPGLADTAERGKNGSRLHRRTCLGQRNRQCRIPGTPRGQGAYLFQRRHSARSVLPAYLRRTEWVLAGASKAEMLGSNQSRSRRKKITGTGDWRDVLMSV